MKLKKIASLALAGIMAVSMLAGCSGSSSSNSTEEPDVTPVVTDVVAGANNVINNYAKSVLGISYTENADLAKALEAAASSTYKSADIEGIAAYADVSNVTTRGKGVDVASKITKSLTGINTSLNWSNGFFDLTAKETKKILSVFTVGGSFGSDDAGAFVAREMNTIMNTTEMPASNNDYKADYTADIAAVKVTSKEDTSKSAWVVAVVITQDVTEV